MKSKLNIQSILIIVLAIIMAYRFSFVFAGKGEPGTQASFVEDKDGFLNYVLVRPWVNDGALSYFHITRHFDSFKELNYNASHQYGGDGQYLGWFDQDSLNGEQRDTLRRIHTMSNQNDLRCFLERARISWLCLSQRLIYEAEGGNYGFSYQNRTAGVEEDSGRTVIHACTNSAHCNGADATPRILCDNIYENLQHTDLYYFHPDSSDVKPWILKPVMRIDSNIFSNMDTTPVVSIISYNYLGNGIDTSIVRVNNFAQNNEPDNYQGQYVSSYSFLDNPLQVSGSITDTLGLNYGRPDPGEDIKNCKVDFKVYWFGLVDVWFDKMIVDDTRADLLFGLDYAGNYDTKIRDYTTKENYQFVMDIIKEKKYTTSNILPINYVLNVMHKELVRKNLLPNGLASAR